MSATWTRSFFPELFLVKREYGADGRGDALLVGRMHKCLLRILAGLVSSVPFNQTDARAWATSAQTDSGRRAWFPRRFLPCRPSLMARSQSA